jgi:hypothetical protein
VRVSQASGMTRIVVRRDYQAGAFYPAIAPRIP